jgi:phenylacetate-coenzyme A ligase PaaK-like adenylate-forming protein
MASPCPSGAGLHVHAENILAEVLDADGRPCRPGETGRLVFTSLHNLLNPFIRYDILDEVTLATEPCPCGRGFPLWTAVDGRRHPLFHLPNGGRKATTGLMLVVRQVGGMRQFQIVQKAVDLVMKKTADTMHHSHNDRQRPSLLWRKISRFIKTYSSPPTVLTESLISSMSEAILSDKEFLQKNDLMHIHVDRYAHALHMREHEKLRCGMPPGPRFSDFISLS